MGKKYRISVAARATKSDQSEQFTGCPLLFKTELGNQPAAVIAGLDPAIHPSKMTYWVYLLASKPGGTLYVGVTNDLVRRVDEHRKKLVPGFTKRHSVSRLVYFEAYDDVRIALQREKNIKHWSRDWKIDLIVKGNPEWRDLFDEIAR